MVSFVSRGALPAILLLFVAACASRGPLKPQPFPQPGFRPSPLDGNAVVRTALALVGTPYRNGGADPVDGFDCSGFVQYVMSRSGVAAPRDVRGLYDVSRPIPDRDLQPGDLVFFTTTAPGPSHVGFALGDARFVHAPSSNGRVRIESLSSRYWADRYLGARRLQ